MKRTLLFLSLIALLVGSCNRPMSTDQTAPITDSTLLYVLQAIVDTNRSCIDLKDDIYELLDTMQSHVESHPDENIRIGAKSLAMNISSLFLFGECCSPEEVTFFIDSLLFRFMDVQHTWYYDNYTDPETGLKLLMTQNLVFRYGDENEAHVITLDLYHQPDKGERLAISLPMEAETLASIVFHHDDMRDIDTTLHFSTENALHVLEQSEDEGEMIIFGEEMIDAMLSHQGMYIAYIGTEETNDISERIHDSHLMLTQFQEQYKLAHNLR